MEQSTIDLSEAALAEKLEHAYAARLAALLQGDSAALTRTGRDVEDLECRWLEHRQLRELARTSFSDTAYYLG
jgi:hypothetical protein